MNYTKGDWTINTVKGVRIESEDAVKCICLLGDIEDEDYANAHLMAAAPKMYEAIKHFIASTKRAKGIAFTPGMHGAWIALNEALALAEGKEG